jgi:hypothetical protein
MEAMARRDLRILLALCVLAVGLAIAHNAAGLSTGFLYMAPALVIAMALVAGRYVGEERLARIACALPTSRPAVPREVIPRLPIAHLLPRGGCLIASSLAVRPPPAALATS